MATAILTRAVEEAVRHAFWAARVWQPRSKEVLRRLAEVSPRAGDEARAYYRAASFSERLRRARSLFAGLGIPTGFFEWESEREAV
jgi:hypothetical protein